MADVVIAIVMAGTVVLIALAGTALKDILDAWKDIPDYQEDEG